MAVKHDEVQTSKAVEVRWSVVCLIHINYVTRTISEFRLDVTKDDD